MTPDRRSSAPPPTVSISGFLGAATSAPGTAVLICFAGVLLGAATFGGVTPDQMASGVFGLFVMFVMATVWGVPPSLVFGGLVLAVIQRLPWRRPPGRLVFMAGGLIAAGLYVATGMAVAAGSQGAAMFFAPWATNDIIGSAGSWWVIVSIVLAGGAAGLFYGLCVRW